MNPPSGSVTVSLSGISSLLRCCAGWVTGLKKISGIPEEFLKRDVSGTRFSFLIRFLSSVAFLESTINELYADAADDAYFFSDEKNEDPPAGPSVRNGETKRTLIALLW